MNELKPCPFCGGEPLFVPNPLGTNNANFNMKGNVGLGVLVTYECEECGSDCGLYHNEDDAKNAWNRRNNPNWIEDMKEWAFSWMEGADEPEFTFFDQVYSAVCWYERKLNR